MMQTRIQQLREERHMTQIRLSIELGVAQETVSAYENGRHYPSVAILMQLAEIFHTSCDYILGLSDQRHPAGGGALSEREQALLAQYRALPVVKRERLQAYLDGLSDGA